MKIIYIILFFIVYHYFLNFLFKQVSDSKLMLFIKRISIFSVLGFGIIISSLTTKYRDLQVLIGFGIKGQKEFSEACKIANGAIVGTAFIELLSKSTDLKKDISEFTSKIKIKQTAS